MPWRISSSSSSPSSSSTSSALLSDAEDLKYRSYSHHCQQCHLKSYTSTAIFSIFVKIPTFVFQVLTECHLGSHQRSSFPSSRYHHHNYRRRQHHHHLRSDQQYYLLFLQHFFFRSSLRSEHADEQN